MPWYMNPTAACVDFQRSEECGKQLAIFHGRHQWLSGDVMAQA